MKIEQRQEKVGTQECAGLFSDANPGKTLAIRPFSAILNYINALLN